jgi:hypothetical protein
MDMFGGLTRTSSRIAIAAAFGLTLGVYALSTPAKAADLGGDCCADLEERVAELEATTVRKGNKKVSVTISGWVVKTMNWWDDGGGGNFAVGDKDADLASRFAITGSATIAPGWSAGYNMTITAPDDTFGILSNQFDDLQGVNSDINTLYSYMYVKSDTWGTLNWGTLSPASDNPAVLADISGTVIESNAVWFEGSGFFLRPSGGAGGLSGLTWLSFLGNYCPGGVGADCFGAPRPAVRYDSPTFGGFRMETSYGTVRNAGVTASDSNFWDIAAFYNGDWGNFKVSAAYAFTWSETAVGTSAGVTAGDNNAHQAGATIMHVPSGLGLYGEYEYQDPNTIGISTTDIWYLKPFIKRTWNPLGATILYGEYGQYNDMYGSIAGADICTIGGFGAGTGVGGFCANNPGVNTVGVTGSEMERWGLGVVQEVDSAAMHLFARWQHQDATVDFVGTNVNGVSSSVKQDFQDWDLFQVGGIIFF